MIHMKVLWPHYISSRMD